MRRIALAVAAACALASPVRAQQQNLLPPGDGHDIVATACTQCHAPSTFAPLREGPDGWRRLVYDMILRGAQVGPDDVDKVVDYLATNFGPGINLPETKPVTLPDGAGKDVVEKNCVLCHGLDRLAATKRSAGQWNAIVTQMVFFGAPLSGDDQKTVTTYLANALGAK
jgi:cytochrome c5